MFSGVVALLAGRSCPRRPSPQSPHRSSPSPPPPAQRRRRRRRGPIRQSHHFPDQLRPRSESAPASDRPQPNPGHHSEARLIRHEAHSVQPDRPQPRNWRGHGLRGPADAVLCGRVEWPHDRAATDLHTAARPGPDPGADPDHERDRDDQGNRIAGAVLRHHRAPGLPVHRRRWTSPATLPAPTMMALVSPWCWSSRGCLAASTTSSPGRWCSPR